MDIDNVQQKSFTMMRGDTFTRTISISCGGAPLLLGENDIGYFVAFNDDDIIVVKELYASDQDASGVITLQMLPEDTETVTGGYYEYEIEFDIANIGTLTIARGMLYIEPDRITPEVRTL